MAKIAGAAQFTAKLRNNSVHAAQFIDSAVFDLANRVQVDAQTSITDGAVSGAGHVPSKPGEPPNNDTGVLASNIETIRGSEPGTIKYVVSSNAPYASALEFGTSRMQARPYLRPALEKNRERISKRLAAAINQANRMK